MPFETTKRVEFEFEGESYFFEFKRVKYLPYDENLRIFPPDEVGQSMGRDVLKRQFASLIVSWNVPDAETGEPLTSPKDDPESPFRAPTDIMELVSTEILKDSQAGSSLNLANGSEISSSTSSSETVREED